MSRNSSDQFVVCVACREWGARSANSKFVPCGCSRQTVLRQTSMQTARLKTVSPSNHVYDTLWAASHSLPLALCYPIPHIKEDSHNFHDTKCSNIY